MTSPRRSRRSAAPRTLPTPLYLDPQVLEQERTDLRAHLAARRADRGAGAGRRLRADLHPGRAGGHQPRPRRGAARLLQRVPASRRAGRADNGNRKSPPVPLPRLDVRPRRDASAPRRRWRRPRASSRRLRAEPVRVETWGPFVFACLDARRRRCSRCWATFRRGERRGYDLGVDEPRRASRLRHRVQLEGLRRQLPRGLPPADRPPASSSASSTTTPTGSRRSATTRSSTRRSGS